MKTDNCRIGILFLHPKDKSNLINRMNHRMNKPNNKEILLMSLELKNLVTVLTTFSNMLIWKSMSLTISERNHFSNLKNQLKICLKNTIFKVNGANIKRVVSFH